MRKVLVFSLMLVSFLHSQSVIWERTIFNSGTINSLLNLYISQDRNIFIGASVNSLSYDYSEALVIKLDINGSIVYEKNYGDLFNGGLRGITQNNSGFNFFGNITPSEKGPTKSVIYKTGGSEQVTDSIIYSDYDTNYSIGRPTDIKNGSSAYIYSFSCFSDFDPNFASGLVLRDSNLTSLFSLWSSATAPDSLKELFDYCNEDYYLYDSKFNDYLVTDTGIIFSGRAYTDMSDKVHLSYIKYYNFDKSLAWEAYYFYSIYLDDLGFGPYGNIYDFYSITINSDNKYIFASLWFDSDQDTYRDIGEYYLTKIDINNGAMLWKIPIAQLPYGIQIINCGGDYFYVRDGIKVSKVLVTDTGIETIWETNFANTGEIAVVDGGYVSASVINNELIVFRYYETTGIEETVVPVSTELHQNYPNPFNPVTEISYSLQREAQVTLSVFNMKGELVSSLVNETRKAGNHAVNFNGEGLNSGIYFYRLSVNGKDVQCRKMMMLK